MTHWLWLIPALPLVGALLNGVVLWKRLHHRTVGALACGASGGALLVSLGVIASYLGGPQYAAGQPFEQTLWEWIPAGTLPLPGGDLANLSFAMGFLLDPLTAVMLVVVTLVGFLIHVYSVGYMGEDPGYQRYFAYLNLFLGAMLLLVLGDNLLVTFIGWEGVGLCSYLLIGFWYAQDFPPYAGRKAFIVNRIGDFGFLVGLFALASQLGTLRYRDIVAVAVAEPARLEAGYLLGLSLAGFVTLCLFIGATGKSAQIPLYVWLPDAMAGPTPVSALIHAATMVTAGVYMVVRLNALYQLAPGVSLLVAAVGAATALMAATIALAQTDIKKVLAYSTVSQLGYMFLAAGAGAYSAAIFHLGTHAFFKALLFLGSGAVIHALGGEQDMRRMGGLRGPLPVTAATFLVGTLAIAGVPGLSGFFSKDQILAAAWSTHPALWLVGVVTAGLTACYMFRAVFLTFYGEFRGGAEARAHLHEAPPVMRWPLILLAVGAATAGWVGLPRLGSWDWNLFDHFLAPVVAPVGHHEAHHASVSLELLLMAVSVSVALAGIWIAWRIWGRGPAGGEGWARRLPALYRTLVNKYWVDELYDATVVRGTWGAARGLYRFDAAVIDGFFVNGSRNVTYAVSLVSGFFDRYAVDGLVNLTARVLQALSRRFRALQTGLVAQYALALAAGAFALLCVYLLLDRG